MNIYLENGYLDVDKLLKPKQFNKIIMVGGRGTGKSYGVLRNLVRQDQKFIYLRTSVSEMDAMKDPDLDPFNPINRLEDRNIEITKGSIKFVRKIVEGEKNLGMVGALKNMYQIRGFDGFPYKILFYDEFIGEKHAPKMKNQGTAVKALYESINRNRELEGFPPLRLIMCANSDDLNNDVLITYDVLDDLLEMGDRGLEVKDFPDRGLRLIYTCRSPISERKRKTANYKGQENSEYNKMALDNKFTGYYRGNIDSKDLKNYDPVVSIGDVRIYKCKNDKTYYVTKYMIGNFPEVYQLTDFERGRFQRRFWRLYDLYYSKKIKFENAGAEIAFINLWEVKK